MTTLEIVFWIGVLIVFYTFIGYGIVLYILTLLKRKAPLNNSSFEPKVTLFVAAFNEKEYIHQKIQNGFELDYPKDKLEYVWVTDGSDDGTPDIAITYKSIKVLHQNERKGKTAAINRGMQYVNSSITVFTDANTLLPSNSIREIVNAFKEKTVGCVSGEKRIQNKEDENAAGAGEGFYWKYESQLKKWDSELYSAVGAAGELFAVRNELFEEVPTDSILDDFMISLKIAMKGYKIAYTPNAYAIETASANIEEELKRKIRIAAGGIQSIARLLPLFNIFKYRMLSFQYISHRVLRWTITPLILLLLLPLNIWLSLMNDLMMYDLILIFQLIFYTAAGIGWFMKNISIKIKAFYIPFYFTFMNVAVFAGIKRYIQNEQSVVWERAKRG